MSNFNQRYSEIIIAGEDRNEPPKKKVDAKDDNINEGVLLSILILCGVCVLSAAGNVPIEFTLEFNFAHLPVKVYTYSDE